MMLVREVAIVLGNFTFLGVDTRWGKVEREKTSVWDLGKVVQNAMCRLRWRLVLENVLVVGVTRD